MKLFGKTPDGKEVNSYELINSKGAKLEVINYGATVSSLKIPLKNGELVDVVLGFDNLENYINSFDLPSAPYLGTTVGRYAGRINNAVFTLNGETIHLEKNNNGNSLHGGDNNFSKRVWDVKAVNEGSNPSITLTYLSPANEGNYPGDLSIELTYTLSEDNELIIGYVAKTTEDTAVNLTHHSYFNLDGHSGSVVNQKLTVNTKQVLEVKLDCIPTGRVLEVDNTPFDFFTQKNCPTSIDNTFVLKSKEELAAILFSEKNNLKMTVYTDQPGVHIYVGGNCFNKIKGKENADYHTLSGICFETQNFPDAPNHKHFPNSILKKGDTYSHNTTYKFETL
ncbi:aldose epimerase family protein [Flavobacterium gilvum]|nr:aldose epimerase family protein [Flavobacterium gilvum]